MGLFSFLGFARKSQKSKVTDKSPESDTTNGITQTQLDELNQLTLYGIDLVKDELIKQGTFLPIGFTYSDRKDFKMIVYEEPGKGGKMSTDYIYEKIVNIVDVEFKSGSIRITCIVYSGIIKTNYFPDGVECISMLFRSKEFDGAILCSYPIKIADGELFFGDVDIQWINK